MLVNLIVAGVLEVRHTQWKTPCGLVLTLRVEVRVYSSQCPHGAALQEQAQSHDDIVEEQYCYPKFVVD